MRIERVVLVHRVMAIFMALLLVFTINHSCIVRLLQPQSSYYQWRAPSVNDATTHISGRNEMAALEFCANNMSEELAEGYAGPFWNSAYRKKQPVWNIKTRFSRFCGKPAPTAFTGSCRYVSVFHYGTEWPANLTQLHDIELRVTLTGR